MKLRHIISTVCMTLLVLPIVADAQIYKWKDKNGVTRYSDTPPIGVKANPIGKEGAPKPINSNPEEAPAPAPNATNTKPKGVGVEDPPPDPEMEAARERAQKAEYERQKKEHEAEQAKVKAENCKAARVDFQTFSQGGRIYQTNEQGERVYMGDAELDAAKSKAQADINKYCR